MQHNTQQLKLSKQSRMFTSVLHNSSIKVNDKVCEKIKTHVWNNIHARENWTLYSNTVNHYFMKYEL